MKSNKLRELLERISADDRPRISDFDELLEALRLHHGPSCRPDLIPGHHNHPKVTRDGPADPGGRTGWPGLNYRASVVWFLLQSAIILAVVQSNISWHWADHGIQVGIVGVGLAYLATLVVSGQQPVIRGEDKPVQQMTRARKVAVLIAACLAVATTQAWSWDPPRPPASIPNVVALMPATVPLTRSEPTPIPPDMAPVALKPPSIPAPRPALMAPAMMAAWIPPTLPQRVMLPPAEFDHEYKGRLTILKEPDYSLVQFVCRDTTPNAIACSFRTYDSVTGVTLSCLILLGPVAHENAEVLRHEKGHCLGWPADHPGARYDD